MLGDGIVSFGSARRHRLLQELKGVAEDRLRDAELAVDVQRRGRELDVALLVVELHGDVAGFLRDAVELVDEVHVPGRAAELAVGRCLQADVLLLADDLADRLVLDLAQRVGVDAPARRSPRALDGASGGRSRLPTWSARNGGFVRGPVAVRLGVCWLTGAE